MSGYAIELCHVPQSSDAELEDFLVGDSCYVGAEFFSASSFVGVSH